MPAPDPPSTPGQPVPAAAGPAFNESPDPATVETEPVQSKLVPATPLEPEPPPPETPLASPEPEA